jgi:hypothetical protein
MYMNAKEYILSQLESLKIAAPTDQPPQTNAEMANAVFKALMSKKFRKYSVPEKNQKIIKAAIEKNIERNEPIKISWPFGGYKLWRLEEAPEADWAELFSIMYIARWLLPVCALYPKGVAFTFWVDEIVISQMNNIPQTDLDAYQKSFASVLAFITSYLPTNLMFDVFLERSQYESNDAFQKGLQEEMEKLRNIRTHNPQPLSEKAKKSIEMNVKVSPAQAKDPLWREKVDLMHYAYYNLQEKQTRVRPSYTVENIIAFTTLFEPNVIPIGTTKTSIAKFWIGVGALERREDSFIETILTQSQIQKTEVVWEQIELEGLSGKNFRKIRVCA